MKILKLIIISVLLMACQKNDTPDQTKKPIQDNIQKVSFVAVGDNIMHQRLIDVAKKDNGYDFSAYYQNIQPYIQEADISFVNQETILGGNSHKYSGYPVFNTPSEMAEALSQTGFDVVNGGTNHCLDIGPSGIKHSIDVFNNYPDMTYIGVYKEKSDKKNIPVIEKNGIKIAFLSYNQLINYESQPPTDYFNPFNKQQIKEDVENAKKISDVIVVSCHWGKENSTKTSEFQKEYAKYLNDLGVDVIVGTHTHTLQEVEWLKNDEGHQTLVAYSLGNFVNGMLEVDSQLGGMLSLDFVKKEGKIFVENVSLVPLMNHYQCDNTRNIMGTRHSFTIYRLKDYTDNLAKEHGLNGYQGITISKEDMIKKAKTKVSKDINLII